MLSHYFVTLPYFHFCSQIEIDFLSKRDTEVITRLEAGNKALDKKLSDLDRHYKSLDRDYDKKRDDFDELDRNYKGAKKKIDDLHQRNRELDEKHTKAWVEIADAAKRYDGLKRELDAVKRQLDVAAEDQLCAVQQHAATKIQLKQSDAERQQLIQAELPKIPLSIGQ